MKIVVQRVSEASCYIEGKCHASIGKGLVLLVCLEKEDENEESRLKQMADKLVKLRIFEDTQGKMNLSIKEVQGEILSISQFTLAANVRKGNRPSFEQALKPELAKMYYLQFNDYLRQLGCSVKEGRFAADMKIHLCNDGPVTLYMDTKTCLK